MTGNVHYRISDNLGRVPDPLPRRAKGQLTPPRWLQSGRTRVTRRLTAPLFSSDSASALEWPLAISPESLVVQK